jgi:lysophospholipase L1-like esterase
MFISEPYPERLQTITTNRDGPGALSVFNAGQCGYNSYHGIMLLKTKLKSLRPNLVTVKYGWNDLLYSNVPPGTYREPSWAVTRGVQDLLLLTALYPYGRKLAMELRQMSQRGAATAAALPKPRDEWTPNVPPPDFEHNLRRIVEIVRSRGAVVWLLTSGDAFMTDEFRGREDAYANLATQQRTILGLGGIKSFRELEELHARYNDTVRKVGADLAAPVVDLAERVYRERAAEHLFTSIDAIHPNESGHALEAEALYRQLKTARIVGLGTRWRSLQPAAPH